jgi:hypothetical protein
MLLRFRHTTMIARRAVSALRTMPTADANAPTCLFNNTSSPFATTTRAFATTNGNIDSRMKNRVSAAEAEVRTAQQQLFSAGLCIPRRRCTTVLVTRFAFLSLDIISLFISSHLC